MSGTLRVHRGLASTERVLFVGDELVGPLTSAVTEVTLEPGAHVVRATLGDFDHPALKVHITEGKAVDVELQFEEDRSSPHLVGGYMQLRHRERRPAFV